MGRLSALLNLPLELQDELNDRIRKAGYGALDEQREWLASRGHKVSRSALGRHSQAMRAADSSLGDPRARLAEVKVRPPAQARRLLMELGRLQVAQARILAQLQALEDNGMDLVDVIATADDEEAAA